MIDGYLSIVEASIFLKISRPTLNSRRKQLNLSELQDGNRTLLKKSELLTLYAKENPCAPSLNLVATEGDRLDNVIVDETTFDLRKINVVDAYGAISLIVAATEVVEKRKSLYLIVNGDRAMSQLCKIGFFKELERRFEGRVFWNSEDLPNAEEGTSKIFLPIKYIAFRGQERQYLEEVLYPLLKKQGFNDEVIGYLGWIIGEIADNALTHAKGPCYILMGQFSQKLNFLEIAIGDTGKGIQKSLKENPKYKDLSDNDAFIKAFQSQVSSWSDDSPRGKGLSDMLSIAMGSGSLLRVDSKELGIMFNFSNGQKELQFMPPTTSYGGTRFCWVLVNDIFGQAGRSDVDQFITRQLGKTK